LVSPEKDLVPKNDNNDILKNFDPVVIDITPSHPLTELRVVRLLSEKLMPLTFGHGSEHYGHPRIDALGLKWHWDFPSLLHFFA